MTASFVSKRSVLYKGAGKFLNNIYVHLGYQDLVRIVKGIPYFYPIFLPISTCILQMHAPFSMYYDVYFFLFLKFDHNIDMYLNVCASFTSIYGKWQSICKIC